MFSIHRKFFLSLRKGLIGQNHYSSGSHCSVKNPPPAWVNPPHSLLVFGKSWYHCRKFHCWGRLHCRKILKITGLCKKKTLWIAYLKFCQLKFKISWKQPFADVFKVGVLKNSAIFTGKHLCCSYFLTN